eukprot:COSAG02_NODE_23854_length_706_cov_0.739703_1_plen_28_part_10
MVASSRPANYTAAGNTAVGILPLSGRVQ